MAEHSLITKVVLAACEETEGLCEPAMVVDTFATDLTAVDDVGGGVLRLIFTTKSRGTGNSADNIVVSKLLVPAQCLSTIAVRIATASGIRELPAPQVAAQADLTRH